MAGIHSKLARLHAGQQEAFASLIDKYAALFEEMPRVCLVLEHDIQLVKDATPNRLAPYWEKVHYPKALTAKSQIFAW